MNDSKQQLINQCNRICEEIEAGGDVIEYLSDILDYQFIVCSKKEYLGSRILVAFGGPNIWINTRSNIVEGYWGGDAIERSYNDEMGIDDYMAELYEN